MSTEIATFGNTGLPAHLADLNADSNIEVRQSLPMISFRGKVWRINAGGSEEIVVNRDGDPVQSVNVVILNYNKARSRAFFEGAYVEGQASAPTCWSHDGVTPDPTGTKVQAAKCASCPQSVKGSRVTPDGKQVTACSQFKRAVVVPAADTTFEPLLLKLPQTSIWDKDAEEMAAKGFYAFDQYMEMLLRKGIKHTASVITKIKFDPRTSYPKLLFGPVDWLPETLKGNIQAQLEKRDVLNKILNVAPDGVAADAGETFEQAAAPTPPAAAPTPPVAPTKPAKPTVVKAVPPAPAPAANGHDPDDEPVLNKPTPAAVSAAKTKAVDATPPPAPATTPPAANSKLTTLLNTWDDA